MRITKGQAAVVTLLNIAIVIALVFLFVSPRIGSRGDTGGDTNEPPTVGPVDPTDTPPAHEKLRDAAVGASDKVLRETRLMGNGDEYAVDVFFRSGTSYIFGNATVAGLDFDGYGGFLCTVNAAGTILGFEYFDGNITAVCDTGIGFAVCADEKIAFIDYSCRRAGEADTDGAALDVFAVDNGKLAVVTQPTPTSLKFAEFAYDADGVGATAYSTRIDSGYTLKYFDCYDFGERFVIAARAYSLPRYDSAVFYTFVPGADATAHYYGGSGENLTRPYAAMPCSSGYFVIAAKNSIATVISLDYSFMTYHSYSLGFTFTDARLLYAGGKYYACFDRSDGAVTYELESDLSRRKLSVLDGVFIDCAVKTDRLYLTGGVPELGASGDKTYVAAQITSPYTDYALCLEMSNASFYGGFDNGGLLTLVLSATGGADLSAPTAGRDLYVVTMQANA